MRGVRQSGHRRCDLPPRARGAANRAYEQLRSRVQEQLALLMSSGGGPTHIRVGQELHLRPGALEMPAVAVRALALEADEVALTLDADAGAAAAVTSEDPSASAFSVSQDAVAVRAGMLTVDGTVVGGPALAEDADLTLAEDARPVG